MSEKQEDKQITMTLYRVAVFDGKASSTPTVLHAHNRCPSSKSRWGERNVVMETVEDVVLKFPLPGDPTWARGFKEGKEIGRLCRICESRMRQAADSGVVTLKTRIEDAACPRCGRHIPENVVEMGHRYDSVKYRCAGCLIDVTIELQVRCVINAPVEASWSFM